MATTYEAKILSVKTMEEAVALIFQNAFDNDSKACLITLMKILDNIIQKPGNVKVRSIKLSNKAFHNKVGRLQGGTDFLLACGFEQQDGPPPLLSGPYTVGEPCLVLAEHNENQSHLITARRLLMTRAIHDLGLKADELPPYHPPPAVAQHHAETATSSSSTNTAKRPASASLNAPFNPYAAHRFDAQSAAIGQHLGPEESYISNTESQLQRLQQQQVQLEQKLHSNVRMDREWRGVRPNATMIVTEHGPGSTEASSLFAGSVSAVGSEKSGDSSLVAARMKQQMAAKAEREQGGFTTKAMRDLAKMKKQKVYSHVNLTIQFPDGCKLQGKFLPKETIDTVKQSMQSDCFLGDSRDFDLYVTPPRRLLATAMTLLGEGLVPAAKIFVSWKGATAAGSKDVGSYLRPGLFESATGASVTAFPEARPVSASSNDTATKKKPSEEKPGVGRKPSREEELMRRMMGGKKSGLSGARGKNTDGKPSSGKPKWFKG